MSIITNAIRKAYGLPPETTYKTTINIYTEHNHPDVETGTWICEDAPAAAILRDRAIAALKKKGWRKIPWILTIYNDILVKDGTEARIQIWTRETNNDPELEKRLRDNQPPFPY